MRENAPLEDWANDIYMGMMYFTLGMQEKAIESVRCNLAFGFETENSAKMLAKFDNETPQKKFAVHDEKQIQPPAPKPQKLSLPVETPAPKIEPPKKKPPVKKVKSLTLQQRAENEDTETMYELGEYNLHNSNRDEGIRWLKNAAVRGHIGVQEALREYYGRGSEAYVWVYLAYLCGGRTSRTLNATTRQAILLI